MKMKTKNIEFKQATLAELQLHATMMEKAFLFGEYKSLKQIFYEDAAKRIAEGKADAADVKTVFEGY